MVLVSGFMRIGNLIDDLIDDPTGDLIRYLSGEVVDFSGHWIDLSHLTDFEQSVLCETRKIGYGSMTVSYTHLTLPTILRV